VFLDFFLKKMEGRILLIFFSLIFVLVLFPHTFLMIIFCYFSDLFLLKLKKKINL
jgi:energy-coupling factor transporter transmembrane protein EcfT